MKKFKYELQDILEIRLFEQEAAEAELAKALAVETQIQNELDQLAVRYSAVKEQTKGSSDFQDVLSANQFYKFVDDRKEELFARMAEAKIVSEEKRSVLNEIMKKTEALKKLKELQLSEYKKLEALEEENEADEMNSIRYGLKK